MGITDIISHRGGALLWPENSRTAFEKTARLPVAAVEFDIHPSRDGKLVVIHDATLDRTTTGTGAVADHDWAALSRLILKASGGAKLLLLHEVMEIFRPTDLMLRLEIKCGVMRRAYPGLPAKIVTALRDGGMLDRTMLTSFQLPTVLDAVRHGMPHMHAWLITPDALADLGLEGVIALATHNAIPMIAIRWHLLDTSAVAKVRGAGLRLGAWACNDETAIRHAFGIGVDGFTTDRPDLALAIRDGDPAAATPMSASGPAHPVASPPAR